ncbi:MAG: hypothetical protein IPN18_08125 [Ignavibacteriales bacterium]|nr:hypothetical protein [Ignavibacteriales bacterium]
MNLREMANGSFSAGGDDTAKRLEEMEKFYRLMEVHYNNFQQEWEEERKKIYS